MVMLLVVECQNKNNKCLCKRNGIVFDKRKKIYKKGKIRKKATLKRPSTEKPVTNRHGQK